MTAPAITESAQSTPVTQEGRYGVEDAIASITHDAVAQTLAENAPAAEPAQRDEKGRFVKAEGTEPQPEGTETAEQTETPAAPVPTDVPNVPAEQAEPEPVALPDGMVAVPAISRELAHPFKIMDADGEIEAPDLTIEFPANGKTRREPLDKVVKLASMGVYNHEREQQVQASKAEVQQTQAQMQQVIAYAKQLETEREALLSSDDLYLAKRAEYEQQNTPEAKLARERETFETQQRQQAFTQAAQSGEQFFSGKLVPAVETITKALPTVTAEEIGAKLLLISDRFKVHTPFGSIIDPRAHHLIEQAIVNEVVPWAQQIHDARESDRTTTTRQSTAEKQALQKAALDAKADAQKARNLGTRAAKPGTGRPGTNAPPPKPIRTVDDAESAALADTMAAMGF